MDGAKLRMKKSPKESKKKHKPLKKQNRTKPKRKPQLDFVSMFSLKK